MHQQHREIAERALRGGVAVISEAGFKLLSVSQRSISEKAPPGGSASSCPTLPKLHRRVYGDGDGDGR